jgi:predicted transposase/invertase (TIGR01784 family)
MAHHDLSYKHLFSHPEMVRDLLEGFVREDWLAQLDYTSLEKVNSSYVTDDLRARADDLVWRVRWGENWIYVYLLMEFQSTVDPRMAVRMLTYIGLLYQDLIKAGQVAAGDLFPPVLPIVLYNGSARWYAQRELSALIHPGPRALQAYRPQLRYLLIDESRYLDSELASLRNLVAALFRLERSRTHAQIDAVLSALIGWLRDPEQSSLRRAFTVWVGKVVAARVPGAEVKNVNELEEMRVIVAERFREWGEQFKREGLLQGQQEGRAQGHQEGEARLLLRQLQHRFGVLPEDVQARVQCAQPEQLELWGEQMLDAATLDALFQVGARE